MAKYELSLTVENANLDVTPEGPVSQSRSGVASRSIRGIYISQSVKLGRASRTSGALWTRLTPRTDKLKYRQGNRTFRRYI